MKQTIEIAGNIFEIEDILSWRDMTLLIGDDQTVIPENTTIFGSTIPTNYMSTLTNCTLIECNLSSDFLNSNNILIDCIFFNTKIE